MAPNISHHPVSFPPGWVIANVPSDAIQIVKIADDLIEVVPLPDPANPSAA